MAIVAAIAAGVQVYQAVSGAQGGGKEDERLAANATAYNEAVAGDTDALAFLLARSRQGVTVFVSGYGEIGGWASESARTDAANKYKAAQAALGAAAVGNKIISSPTAQGLAQATGNTIVPGTKSDITVLLLVAAVAVFFVARKTR